MSRSKTAKRRARQQKLKANKSLPVLRAMPSGEPAEFIMETLEAAEGQQSIKKFSMVAYTGGPMFPSGWWRAEPLIVDLEGLRATSQSIPVDTEHSTIVGHTTAIEIMASRVKASGVFSAFDAEANTPMAEAAREVIRLAKNEFPWQSSMEFEISRPEFVQAGDTVKVNGRVFNGPAYVARKSTLRRISFVANGADSNTSTSVAATADMKGAPMNEFEKWLKAKGFTKEDLNDSQLEVLEAAFKAENQPDDEDEDDGNDTPQKKTKPIITRASIDVDLTESRNKLAAEAERTSAIQKICSSNSSIEIEVDGKKVNLQSHAIKAGWDAETTSNRFELETLRAARPEPRQEWFGFAKSGKKEPTFEVLEAAFCKTRMLPVENDYSDEVLSASDQYRGLGLQQLILICAAYNGYPNVPGERIGRSNINEICRYAMGAGSLRASHTPISLPGILGNVANKEIRAGYDQEPSVWRKISRVQPISNFYTHTSYRLLENMEYEELSPSGEIQHGQMDQESYTRRIRTYAKMFSLRREDIINDDLSAFEQLQTIIGRGSAQKINRVFWLKFLDNSTFFTAARGNYITGSTTDLDVDGVGLELGLKDWYDMKTPAVGSASAGRLVGGEPKFLLVPSGLSFAANKLYKSEKLYPAAGVDTNIHYQMYEPVVASQLGDSSYTNYSTTAWYLLRDPRDMPTMVVSFLDGIETPTVESSDVEFNMLGFQWRGYHDFGCDQAEYLGGLKSKGAA